MLYIGFDFFGTTKQTLESRTSTKLLTSIHNMFRHNTHFAREVTLKYIIDTKMEESTRVRNHVLKMMDYLNEV